MDIEPEHLDIISAILVRYPYAFYVFGSRATGHAKRFSDLDLCFMEDIPQKVLLKLEEEFEESDLPYKVDLVDWHACDEEFQEIIRRSMVRL